MRTRIRKGEILSTALMGKRSSSDPEKVCRFDPMVLGSECDYVHNFGYDDGTPCILLKINRVSIRCNNTAKKRLSPFFFSQKTCF